MSLMDSTNEKKLFVLSSSSSSLSSAASIPGKIGGVFFAGSVGGGLRVGGVAVAGFFESV